MIIDAHAHAAGPYATATSIQGELLRHGMDKVILCAAPRNSQATAEPPKLPIKNDLDGIFALNRMLRFAYRHFIKGDGDGNGYVRSLADKLPDTILPFLWVDPLDSIQMSQLEKQIDDFAPKGIKLHQAWNAFAIDGPQFAALVEIATAHRLPVFLHLYSKAEAHKVLRFAREHRDATLILAHMLGSRVFLADNARLENVYFDTSGSERVHGQDIRAAIDFFGSDHVIFGTDTPYAPIAAQIEKIARLDLPGEAMDRVMGGNILRVLGMGSPEERYAFQPFM